MSNVIDSIINENREIIDYFKSKNEISFLSSIDNHFRKIAVLSAASYFEYRIIDIIINYIKRETSENEVIVSFLQNKAIKRQYHTFFNWESKNANQFWGLFGENFKAQISDQLKDPELKASIEAFLEIGNYRNRMVHQNFANFYMDKTTDEIYELHNKALLFVDFIEKSLLADC